MDRAKKLEKLGFLRHGEKTPQFFEEWAKRNCMKPVCKVEDPHGDILIADSHDVIKPHGIYRTGYAIHRSGLELGCWNDYPSSDFFLESRRNGLQKRVNEALEHARETQRQLVAAGFYDAERKGRFSNQ